MRETKASDAVLDETEQESEVEGSAWVCAYLCNYICVDFICLLYIYISGNVGYFRYGRFRPGLHRGRGSAMVEGLFVRRSAPLALDTRNLSLSRLYRGASMRIFSSLGFRVLVTLPPGCVGVYPNPSTSRAYTVAVVHF